MGKLKQQQKRMEESGGGGGVRLHVGGLGESVGKDDLLKIFSPMGTVDSVEFVRTKGRSFAYIDFSPSSNKSLTKLFSTYNGCVWKGGKLRLEKAKEHYLARLKREWENSSSASDDTTIKAPSDSTPSTHLNIFFPRLRKVKAMPLTGTGKHKYSFQRVPVSSLLPKSFCDCEEHSNSLTPRETHVHDLEALNVGINEDEVNVMNSVMNKIFQKNNVPNSEQVPEDFQKNDIPNSEQVPEEDSEIEADQDNLIINVASSGNDRRNAELDILTRKRKSILNETTANGEEYSERRKGNHIHPSKKRQSIILEGSGRQEASQAICEKKKPSEVVPDKSSDELSRTTVVKRSIDNISWSQRSSWKALMANGNSSDFSVSSFLPGVGPSKVVQPAPRNTDLAGFPSQENLKKKTKSKGVTSTIVAGDLPVSDDIEKDDSDSMADDIERDDSDAVEDDTASDSMADDVERDDSDAEEDDTASDSMADDVERDDSDAEEDDTASDSMADDIERDDSDAVEDDTASDSMADDVERDDSDGVEDETASDSMANDTASDAVADDTAIDSVADDTASDYVVNDTASDAVDSDPSEALDTCVEVEPLELVASTDGDSGNGKLDVENHENVAENLNAEKESLVLKDNAVDEEEAGNGQLKACNKSTGGSSWLQKASWTQLVSDKNTSSFSITQLFPDLNSDKGQAARMINNGDGQYSTSKQSESGMTQRDNTCSTGGFEATRVPLHLTPVRSLEENQQTLNGRNLSAGCKLGAKKTIRRKIGSGETCTFMRSSASLKEWAKAKKALSEPSRKKSEE